MDSGKKRLVAVWLTVAALVVSCAATAYADPIGPDCTSCNGGIYTLTYSGSPISSTATTQTYAVTLTIDTTGLTISPDGVAEVAMKISSSLTSHTIAAGPVAAANWTPVAGGINDNGCSGAGSGFGCANWNVGLGGAPITNTMQWTFNMTIPTGTLATSTLGAEIKVRYVDVIKVDKKGNPLNPSDWYDDKVGALVSEKITLQGPQPPPEIPEPGTLLLLGSGLSGLVALRLRRSTRQN